MGLWTNLWSQTAAVHVYTGYNDCGNASYNPPRKSPGMVVPCRVEYKQRETVDSKGNKITSTAIMFCDSAIPALSLVTVDGQQFMVISCAPCRDISGGIDHYEITL